MTNRHLFLCMLLAASPLWTAQTMAQTTPKGQAKLHLLEPSARKAVDNAAQDDTKEATVLINETFEGLSSGTEDEPDGTKLVNELGDFIDPSVLCPYSPDLSFRTWGGEGLYAAGGAIAIREGWFLNTPAGDMSGNVKLTFRARLTEGATNDDGNKAVDLIFLSRKELIDYERRQIDLTTEWQTFTFTSDKGGFEATGFQFMCNTSATVLLDDIRVEREQTSIAAPKAADPIGATEYGFTAAWSPTADADDYLLDVYTKSENADTVKCWEDFHGIAVDEDGFIDAEAPNYPEGWGISWADDSKPHGQKGNDDAPFGLILTDEGDRIDLPKSPKGLSKLSFVVKVLTDREINPYESFIELSFDTDYGLYTFGWIDLYDLLGNGQSEYLRSDLVDALAMFDGVYSLRLQYLPMEGETSKVLVSGFDWAYPAPPTLNYLLQDERVEARNLTEDEDYMTHTVTGLDPDEDYYYTVRARNGQFTSSPSNEIEVYTVSQPTVLEPSEVTDSCYTARWTSHNKVDLYRVEQIQQNAIADDTDNFEILYEDFSGVHSEFKEADIADGFIEQGEYTGGYRTIDDLTHIAGWTASSLQWVEGWLGGMAASGQEGTIAGAISTPFIDLSHNDGECQVTVRAWGQPDDWLAIQGINAACYAGVRFPEGGFVEETVTIPCCSAKESLTFYSNNYYPFLIDYIRIAQNVKAGDTVSVVTASVHTADATVKEVLMDNPGFGQGHDVAYRVTGLRYRHGDLRDRVASAPSDLMVVKPVVNAVRNVADGSLRVAPVHGGIAVKADRETRIEVLMPSGQTVAVRRCAAGTTRIDLPQGLYIVRAEGTTAKVVVR